MFIDGEIDKKSVQIRDFIRHPFESIDPGKPQIHCGRVEGESIRRMWRFWSRDSDKEGPSG